MEADDYMRVAIEEAEAAKAEGELPFGAVIVHKEVIITRGRSRERSQKTVLAHAELSAIDAACKGLQTTDLSDCIIYCTNEPCLMCAAAIMQAKIKMIIIGAARHDLPNIQRERRFRIEDLANDSGYNPLIVHGVMRDKVLKLFEDVKK
jgi:tRNA(Arg) A34 adenosine deaminase TadA